MIPDPIADLANDIISKFGDDEIVELVANIVIQLDDPYFNMRLSRVLSGS